MEHASCARRWIILGSSCLLVAGIAGYFLSCYEPGADASYDTSVAAPALQARHPRVLFDAGHRNMHSVHGRYRPFARLIESDGCRVSTTRGAFTRDSLSSADILVVVNAIGPRDRRQEPAFTGEECDAVHDWVEAGGSLLLVADHYPYGTSAAPLASRFGVDMSGGWTEDQAHARPGSGDPGQLVFSRDEKRLGEHAITRGGASGDAVGTVESFLGQSLTGPAGSTPLLLLAETAVDRIPVSSESKQDGSRTITTFRTEDRPAAGRCQGLALACGKGRVVVLAEAAMLTAQIADESGRPVGMNAPDNDNRAFTLNVLRWLAGALGD